MVPSAALLVRGPGTSPPCGGGGAGPHTGARISSQRLSVTSSDGNRMRVLLLHVHPHKHACVGTRIGVRARRSVCVCLQSTNMFSASSRSHNQSSLRNLSNSHPQKRLLPAGTEMSQQRQLREEESSLVPEPASPSSWPGRLAWVTALAPMSQNTFLELASTGG